MSVLITNLHSHAISEKQKTEKLSSSEYCCCAWLRKRDGLQDLLDRHPKGQLLILMDFSSGRRVKRNRKIVSDKHDTVPCSRRNHSCLMVLVTERNRSCTEELSGSRLWEACGERHCRWLMRLMLPASTHRIWQADGAWLQKLHGG